MLRRYGAVSFFAVAVISAVSIMFWGFNQGEDELFDDEYPIAQRIGMLGERDLTFIDDLGEFAARDHEEIRVVAADLIDWAEFSTSEDDALLELATICDSVPRPPAGVILEEYADPSAPPPFDEPAVASICAAVDEGVVRRTPSEWASAIDADITRFGYPYANAGRASIDAQIERMRVWAESVLGAHEIDLDYVARLCGRGFSYGFGDATSPPLDEESTNLVARLRSVCTDAPLATNAVDLSERIVTEFPR